MIASCLESCCVILQVWELVLEMQGYVLRVAIQFPPLITENFLLTSSLQLPLCFQPNECFPAVVLTCEYG